MSRQKPQYNSRQVLELAIEVDKTQGFVKSGFGYFDREADKRVNDNKTCILHFMQGLPEAEDIVISDATKKEAGKNFQIIELT